MKEQNFLKRKGKFDETLALKKLYHDEGISEREANLAFKKLLEEEDLEYKKQKRTTILSEKNQKLG
jgi:hypothetical protein